MAEKILLAHTAGTDQSKILRFLRNHGYQVLTAASLDETVGLLGQFPDLLLLDADLGKDSPLAMQQLGTLCCDAHIPALVFSSSPDARLRQRTPWAEVMERHENGPELLARIAGQLRLRRLSDELRMVRNHLQQKEREYEENLRSAAQVQKSLLPSVCPTLRNCRLAWRFLPCASIGGDIFNVLQLDEKTVMFYLLDVSGHGISSAMVSVAVYQSMSLQTGQIVKRRLDAPPYYRIPPPAEVLDSLEEQYPFERFEKFFTITYLLLDIDTGHLRYSNAGHPPPLLLRHNGQMELLQAGGTIIGLGSHVPFTEGEALLQDGDRLFLYSDGITEHMNRASELFGEQRLQQKITTWRRSPLDHACEKVIEALHHFGQGSPLRDDATLLGIELQQPAFAKASAGKPSPP
jgi:phosphoserine phosphatase RsbU/P